MEFLSQLTLLQWLGTIFGVVQVLLARQNNIHNYLFGIVAILISIWVLYQSQLYADILLNLYYLVMSVYGWFYWKMGKQKQETPISTSNRREHTIAGGIVLGCFGLMAKRKIENWIYLNISNFISIPLLIYKELYIYAGLTAFLFAVAISGYIKWKKIIAHERDGTYAGA